MGVWVCLCVVVVIGGRGLGARVQSQLQPFIIPGYSILVFLFYLCFQLKISLFCIYCYTLPYAGSIDSHYS